MKHKWSITNIMEKLKLALPDSSIGKESAGKAGDSVSILGWEDALEKG